MRTGQIQHLRELEQEIATGFYYLPKIKKATLVFKNFFITEYGHINWFFNNTTPLLYYR